MPRAYRRAYRRYRRYPYLRRRYWGSSRFRKRYYRNGVVNSRSRVRVRIPKQAMLTVQIPANTTAATSVCIMPWCNTTATTGNNVAINAANGQSFGFTDTGLFQAYCGLFDEVKFDGMKVRAAVVDTIGAGGAYAGVTVASVIERMCQKEDVPPNSTNMNQWSSYSFRNVINNSVAKISRSVWATDLNERIQFLDTELIATGAGTPVAAPGNCLRAWRDGSVGSSWFKPAIYLTATPSAQAAALRTINFMVEVVAYFTFRCPKYSSSGSSKQAEDFTKLLNSTKEDQVDDQSFDRLVHEDTLLDIPITS